MATQIEEMVSIDEARKKEIPVRPNGKPVIFSTVWRWAWKGLQGLDGQRIKLEITYVGNRPMVTKTAIREFFRAVTEAKRERHRRAEALAADVTVDELAAAGLQISGRNTTKSVRNEVAQ